MKRDIFQKMCLTISSGLMLNYEMRQRLSKGQSGMDNPETLTTLGKQIHRYIPGLILQPSNLSTSKFYIFPGLILQPSNLSTGTSLV
jgi:hypothetical protein